MRRTPGVLIAWLEILAGFVTPLAGAGSAGAKPALSQVQDLVTYDPSDADIVGNRDAAAPEPRKTALGDTLWIVDWSFDSGGGCTSAGWTAYDNRILNDGSNYWSVTTEYSGQGAISGEAARLAKHDLCWVFPDGYGNNWDYSIRIDYRGTTTLDFDFQINCDYSDFVRVEADSACASFARVNYVTNPNLQPSDYRRLVGSQVSGGTYGSQHFIGTLPDFGFPGTTHCVYIRFVSDGATSAETGFDGCGDACLPNSLSGLVVDNIMTSGGNIPIHEDFTGPLDPHVTLLNTAPSTPFGLWARLYQHITDNDKCTENTTCAWLWTDPNLIAVDPSTGYGPGSAIIHNWLDNIILSPWVSLVSTSTATGTVLSYRRFAGNPFAFSEIVQNWSLRSHTRTPNTDTVDPADSLDCYGPWMNSSSWNTLNTFAWSTNIADASSYIARGARDIQVRFRVSDWMYLNGDTPPTFHTGPGPYNDRIRIGRRILAGPVINEGIDSRSQAQDRFPSARNAIPGGEHFSPTTDRFGTCDFSQGTDLTAQVYFGSPNLVTGDSIHVSVTDVRGAGGITSVNWYGSIVSGPHAGKSPAPYAMGTNGFFAIPADSVRNAVGSVIANNWFVDMDDTYFRGGDSMIYFWTATDVGGGFTSDPVGMTALPLSRAAAEAATGGLLEVGFLPSVNWSAAYLARVAADAHGDLDPTSAELAASHQANCILYDELVNFRRRSGDINRTSMMYTLDRLGYRGHYDVYDQQGYGNTNNQLGARATVQQLTGYALVIQDNGKATATPVMPNGGSIATEKIDMVQFYRSYLANGGTSEIGTASFWLVAENALNEKPTAPLYNVEMGTTFVSNDQGLGANPNVEGRTSFGWANGATTSFAGDLYSLSGGCPVLGSYDGLGASGTGVITHAYRTVSTLGPGAIVINKDASLKWNTVMQSHAWFDIRDVSGGPTSPNPANPSPEAVLMTKILAGVLPGGCQRSEDPTPVLEPAPRVTALYQNVPNPFNPATVIQFDLAREGRVELRVFDVAGRIVRTLVDGKLPGTRHRVVWNGLDDAGRRVSSGAYLYRLIAADFTATRKLVVLK